MVKHTKSEHSHHVGKEHDGKKEETMHEENAKPRRGISRGWIIFGVILLVPVLVLGYFGFIPVLSDIMGANRAKDLGVDYSEADFNTALQKTGVKLESLPKDTPKEKSIQMWGKKQVKTSFTQEELTAHANIRKWIYYPVKDVQIKINDDGTAEASAKIRTARLMNYAIAKGTPKYYMDMFDTFDILPNPSVYVKGKASVSQDQVSIDLKEAEIGRFSLKGDVVEKAGDEIEYFVEGGIKRTPGLSVKSLDFSGGKLNFDGTLPEVEASVNE